MEDNYLRDIKKLMEEHKKVQDKNLKLVNILNQKLSEIKLLRDNEAQLQTQIKDVLMNNVNLENISGQYMDLKDKYEKLLEERKTSTDTYKKKENELVENYEKQIKMYQEMLSREQERFTLKENEYLSELKKTSNVLNDEVEKVELKWKNLLEDANRKLKESNLSCTTLRTQLVKANYKHTNYNFLEKKVQELETKLEEKENELNLARQVLFIKENYKSPVSPARDLYKSNVKKGPYKIPKKQGSPSFCGDSPQNPSIPSSQKSIASTSASQKRHIPSLSESALDNSFKSMSFNKSGNKQQMHSSCELTPVKELPEKPKKRKLYNPITAHMDYMMKNPEDTLQ